jgi:hypothetical protein
MKRSQDISLRLVPVVAAAFLASCGTPPRRSCVDQSGRVVADANCTTQPPAGAGASWDTPGSGQYYHWVWYRGSAPIIGSRAPVGSWYSARASSATTRGGFGSTAAAHAGAAS